MEEPSVNFEQTKSIEGNGGHSRNESSNEFMLDEQTDLHLAAAMQSFARVSLGKRSSVSEVEASNPPDVVDQSSAMTSRRSSTTIPAPANLQKRESDSSAVNVLGSVAEVIGLSDIKRAPPLPVGPPPITSTFNGVSSFSAHPTSSIPRPSLPPSDPIEKPQIQKSITSISNVQQSTFPLAANKPKIEKAAAAVLHSHTSSNFHIPAAAKQPPAPSLESNINSAAPTSNSSLDQVPTTLPLPPSGPKPKPAILKSIPGAAAASIPKPAGPPPPSTR